MLLDDHEITDDWNLDADWAQATRNPTARRVISNGLAAYWAFQAWGNDPSQFGNDFVDIVKRHLQEMSDTKGRPGPTAAAFDEALHAKQWSYIAPTQPLALCVDTRTRRVCVGARRAQRAEGLDEPRSCSKSTPSHRGNRC